MKKPKIKKHLQFGNQHGGRHNLRSEPEGIGSIVSRWLKSQRFQEQLNREDLNRRWTEIVGEDIASQTRAVRYNRGVLTVEVASAPLLNELSTFYRQEILASVCKHPDFDGIHEIRFRPGAI